MPAWRGVVGTRFLWQGVLAADATARPVMDDRFGKALGRQSHAQVGAVSGLAAALASCRLFANGWRCLRRIIRRGNRRVGGILAQAFFLLPHERGHVRQLPGQVGDLLLQSSNARVALTTSWTLRLHEAPA